MNLIVASIPGRLRLRDKGLQESSTLRTLESLFQDHPAVTGLRGNRRAGSLVVEYDVARLPRARMEQEALEIARPHLGMPPAASGAKRSTPARPPRRRGPRPLRMRVNRVAKVAMLVSLGVSLAVAELRPRGWKHWHATTGWAFVVALAVHLYVYRRHLVR